MRQSRRHFIHKTKNWREASRQMTKMSDKTLLDVFKTIKSEEDSTNCFSVAAAKRKSLALNYYGSLQLKESPEAMEFLIGEDLDEYAELVDNTEEGKVNNYADSIFSIFSNFQNDERHSWQSHLSSFNLKNHIKSLSCSNTINCKNSVEPFYDSQVLKQAFSEYKEIKEPEESGDKARLFKRSYCSESNVSAAKNVITPEELGDKARLFKRSFCSENNLSAEKNIAEEDVSKNRTSLNFRTARDELQLQNYKKFGKTSNPSDKQNQGQLKKTLGARKGGVFGKFQPPLRSNENMENESKVDTDKAVDERLKNIDPAMIELIKNEIMDSGPTLSWNDIAGLNLAKSIIQEIVVWPMLRPDIFTGLRRPPKGILLFGPPGTGKTLIGKCVASQSNSTFFSISASSLTSKWVGDGEKMVRTLFAVAKVYQPSVVFIDEIDSLLTQRSDSDHECSRRIKTEFLVQLDGAGTGDEDRILIIGATNRPQELDEAARRRLVKRLYIPLPDEEARKQIIQNLISTERHCLTESEIENLAKMTNGYSGADVKNLCQEASLGPIRSVPPTMIQTINPEDVRPLNFKDFESALRRIKSSVSEGDLDVYLKWDKQYGCGSGFN